MAVRPAGRSLGAPGRAAYRHFYVSFDFWFPALFSSLTLAVFIALMLRHTDRHRWLIATPVIPYLFDVAENLTHLTMAGQWPDTNGPLWSVGPLFTGGKWLTLGAVLGVALFTVWIRLTSPRPPTPRRVEETQAATGRNRHRRVSGTRPTRSGHP